MPREGWSTIGVRDAYLQQIEQAATKEGRSASNYLERKLIEKGIVKEAGR